MHLHGLVHTDVKPSNILLRGKGVHHCGRFGGRLQEGRIGCSNKTQTAANALQADAFRYLVPSVFDVKLADLGSAIVADPQHRFLHLESWTRDVPICTLFYRPPDMLLGNRNFGPDLDVWSVACVAAELELREPFFQIPENQTGDPGRHMFLLVCATLGLPAPGTPLGRWVRAWPFFHKFFCYGERALGPAQSLHVDGWRKLSAPMADFARALLLWRPEERPSAASAKRLPFLMPRPLSATLARQTGKRGSASLVQGFIDNDLLHFLQNCPAWESLREEFLHGLGPANACIRAAEQRLRAKNEYVGYSDFSAPAKCRNLNGDSNLGPVVSRRVSLFARALRRCARPWLHQLTARVRAAIRKSGLPEESLLSNGMVFLEEDFADNAFVYATVQVLAIGEREDGWHTDGGASLLHAGLTIFGSRTVQLDVLEKGRVNLHQRPGSFYIGNLCAVAHNVAHSATSQGNCGPGPSSEQVQIAIMFRTDVFRGARARKIDATPGPAELFCVVNDAVARHLAEEPFRLPELDAVLAEEEGTDGAAASAAGKRKGSE